MKDNKLIAEFMGYICSGDDEYLIHPETNYDHSINDEDWFLYSTSWDWLMPVISKCYQEHNRDAYFIQHNKHLLESIKNCDIDKAHQIVVEFIKNQNN